MRVALQAQICDDKHAFTGALDAHDVESAAAWMDDKLRSITKQLPRNEPLAALVSLTCSERRTLRHGQEATDSGTQSDRQMLHIRKTIEAARQRRLYQGVGLMARHNILKTMWATLSAECGLRPREHSEAKIDAAPPKLA